MERDGLEKVGVNPIARTAGAAPIPVSWRCTASSAPLPSISFLRARNTDILSGIDFSGDTGWSRLAASQSAMVEAVLADSRY